MYERTITIDIDRPYTGRIPSVQCDSGRKVKVKLTNQGKPMDLTGTRVVLACVKPDGHEVFNDAEIVDKTKGEVTFALTEQINAEVGQVRSVLKLYDGETLVTSKEFFISVDTSVGTSVASSSNELNALTNALNEVQNIDNRFAQTNAQLSQEIDVERKRIDNFNTLKDGSTTGDAELKDIRIGHDGVTYPNAGTAVREQIRQVASKFEQSINQLHLDNLTSEYEINPSTGELRSATGWRATDFMPLQPNDYIFVYKENGKYIYGASCFWAVYDSNKQYITGSVTDAAGVDFINAKDARVAYIRASFFKSRLQAEPMIVPKSAFSKLKDYLTPFKGVLLKDSPYITNTDLSPLQTQLDTMTHTVQHIENQFTYSTNVLLLDNLTSEYEINPSTGELRSATGWRATDFMPLQPNKYIFVYKENGKYIYGASCFWAVYDSNKQYITGSITDAAGVDFINASDERVAYIRASFFKSRLQAEPMIVPKTYYSELEDYLPPFKGVLLKDSPYLTECNSAFETDIRKRRIVAPKNVAVVQGHQLDVHYDNILLGADARLMPYKNYYGSAPAVNMGDMFRIESLQSNITTKPSFKIRILAFVVVAV